MKSLLHQGLYIVVYNPIGLSIKFKGQEYELSSEAEQMAIAFVKKFDTPYFQDEVWVKNFLSDFSKELNLDSNDEALDPSNYDWTEIQEYLENVKTKTEAMTKEEKKIARELKKKLREELKEKYGYAILDGKKVPIMNWIGEPPSIFMSKGKNPLRGHWKRGITKKEITLNLSEIPKDLENGWAEIVWKPNDMWIASWTCPLTGKRKYAWLSPTVDIRQAREQEKFNLASKLRDQILELEEYVKKELCSKDKERRKLATAVYLIKELAIRVGDERIAGEHGTVGCTTLKAENITLEKNNLVILDFLGKDWTHWHRELTVPRQVFKNLKEFKQEAGNDFVFKGLNSNKVSKFLRAKIPGLSAKVFRTYMAGMTWDKAASENLNLIRPETSYVMRKYLFKLTNLAVAQKLNHQKALPKNYEQRLEKKETQLKKEQAKLKTKNKKGSKNLLRQVNKIEKIACDLELLKKTASWNLNTSLTSYIDPRKVIEFMKKASLNIEDVYSKSLREKYSWAIEGSD